MNDSSDSMQELLSSFIDQTVEIEFSNGERIVGCLSKVGGGLLLMKTKNGQKARKVVNVEGIDLLDEDLAGTEMQPGVDRNGATPERYESSAQSERVAPATEEWTHQNVRVNGVKPSIAQVAPGAGEHVSEVAEKRETESSQSTTTPVQVKQGPVGDKQISVEQAVVPVAQSESKHRTEFGAKQQVAAELMLANVDPGIIRKAFTIEAQLAAKIEMVHLALVEPDFARPADLKDQKQKRLWESILNRYKNAVRIHELAPHYGRIQPILQDLEALIALLPTSPALRRYYAYLHFHFAKDVAVAVDRYRVITYLQRTVADWYNLAVFLLMDDGHDGQNQRRWAYHALSYVFQEVSLLSYLDAWYIYVGLLREWQDYLPLRFIYDAAIKRGIVQEEEQHLLEACVYLLKSQQDEDAALALTRRMQKEGDWQEVLKEVAETYFRAKEVHVYQSLQHEWEQDQYRFWQNLSIESQAEVEPSIPLQSDVIWTSSSSGSQPVSVQSMGRLKGEIYKFNTQRMFGFIRGEDWQEYFFHQSALVDESLKKELSALEGDYPSMAIPVFFVGTPGSRGPVALNVSRQRDVKQTFAMAVNYANDGEYEKANAQIKIVLAQDPDYPKARELYENWREFARARGVPRGTNPYARAKRKQLIEKDLQSAIELFREAINRNDTTSSAIKDLASLYMQMERPQEAITLLLEHRGKVSDQQSINNLLVNTYQKAKEYAPAIALLKQMLVQVPKSAVSRKAQFSWSIGNCYLRMKNYTQAEYWFREVIKLGENTKAAQRNLAVSLLHQGREEDAETLLQANLPDTQSAELLDAIIKARETGQSFDIAAFDTEVTLGDFSSEISPFARFFIERCEYEGVDSQHRINKQFDRMDVRKLEELASRLGTRRPRERAEYYLSAAKIMLNNEDWEEEYSQLYKYLGRSFSSRGDAAITENKPVDTAREWYCEALSVYDRDRGSKDEQDAANAIVRFLFATISRASVPFRTEGEKRNLSIDEGLDNVLRVHNQPEKAFGAIAYIAFRSQFAASRLLTRLYAESDFQRMALVYLRSQGIGVPEGALSRDQFSDLWKKLQLKNHEHNRDIVVELHTVANRIDLTTAAMEENLSRLRLVEQKLFFEYDRHQLDELQKILEAMLDLSRQSTFEEKERLCTQIEKRCQDLLSEIESNPTRILVENVYPIVTTIRAKNGEYLERTYESSVPQLTLRLPKDMESYVPDSSSRRFEVQIVIENEVGCSPADTIELVIQEDNDFFTIDKSEIKLEGSLRGGDQRIKPVQIQVTELAMKAQAVTLPIYAQYRTRAGDTKQTQEIAFTVNLYAANQFERIRNPYAAYANSHIVKDEDMFFGRSELITNIAETIGNAGEQRKAILIYGQKRSGKSSILYHLKLYLQQHYTNLLVIDMGSVGVYMDDKSATPLLYQLLANILQELRYAIEDEVVSEKKEALDLDIPSAIQFYAHPTPLHYFQDVLKDFSRAATRKKGWQNVHIVLLLDEFSYIYGLIMRGQISKDFMKNWKAILQQDLFSVVLVGQDVMPKFKAQFYNEFAASEDRRISYLEPDEARKLIDEPIRIGGKQGESRYREKAIDRIIDLTAASPFYIQIFCNRLVEYMDRRRINLVTQADVEQVKNELIKGANSLEKGNFDNLISSGDTAPDAIPEQEAEIVLKTIADNSLTGWCSRDRITVETQTDIEDILKDLLTREVIESKGQNYAIRVGLFKEWLNDH